MTPFLLYRSARSQSAAVQRTMYELKYIALINFHLNRSLPPDTFRPSSRQTQTHSKDIVASRKHSCSDSASRPNNTRCIQDSCLKHPKLTKWDRYAANNNFMGDGRGGSLCLAVYLYLLAYAGNELIFPPLYVVLFWFLSPTYYLKTRGRSRQRDSGRCLGLI